MPDDVTGDVGALAELRQLLVTAGASWHGHCRESLRKEDT